MYNESLKGKRLVPVDRSALIMTVAAQAVGSGSFDVGRLAQETSGSAQEIVFIVNCRHDSFSFLNWNTRRRISCEQYTQARNEVMSLQIIIQKSIFGVNFVNFRTKINPC